MNHCKGIIAATTSTLIVTSTALAAFPSFDDLTAGTIHLSGDSFTSDGIAVTIQPFQFNDGAFTSSGFTSVSTALTANGSGNELNTNNSLAVYNFAGSIGPQPIVRFLFGEFGGNINFAVNGDFVNVENFLDLPATLGGASISIVSGGNGNDAGELLLLGDIHELQIGGQELAVDVLLEDGNGQGDDECAVAFEDLPLNKQYFPIGSPRQFVTDGVPCKVFGLFKTDGSLDLSGVVQVVDFNNACGSGQELLTFFATVEFDFNAVSPVENVEFKFGEYGGNINVEINGHARNVPNYSHLDGQVIGGVLFTVVSGGNGSDCGRVKCDGVIRTLLLGGMDHAVDCLEWDWVDDSEVCANSYNDLELSTAYANGDVFTTDEYVYSVQEFLSESGALTTNGSVIVEDSGRACGVGNELRHNNATSRIERADGDSMGNVTFRFGEHGGTINLEINGDLRNFDNMLDIDGQLIGGVSVSIDQGGNGNDCGRASLTGTVKYLRIGGEELWINCFAADPVAATQQCDLDGDGDVDVTDLLALLMRWGTAHAATDLDSDGIVASSDLLILLGDFGT